MDHGLYSLPSELNISSSLHYRILATRGCLKCVHVLKCDGSNIPVNLHLGFSIKDGGTVKHRICVNMLLVNSAPGVNTAAVD